MTTKQKHDLIRQALAAIGYHVRNEKGKPLAIVRNQVLGQAA